MIWPLFKFLGQKLSKFFVGILVQTMTPKGHFEINWPLKKEANIFQSTLKSEGCLFTVFQKLLSEASTYFR